jgi:hypothetical protein
MTWMPNRYQATCLRKNALNLLFDLCFSELLLRCAHDFRWHDSTNYSDPYEMLRELTNSVIFQ